MEPSSSADVLVIEDQSRQKLPARHLTALLCRSGLRVRLVDLNDGVDEIIALAKKANPRAIVSFIFFADRLEEHIVVMTALRGVCPQVRLAFSGHLPALNPLAMHAACPALDSILCDGSDILQWAATLGFRVQFPSSDHRLPFPARDGEIPTFHGYGFAAVEASWGCYHTCTFCLPSASFRSRGIPYRLRGIPDLVDEIEELYRQGTRLFLFDDDQFLPPKPTRIQRVDEFTTALEERDLKIAFSLKCRADDMEEELFRQLKESGLLRVYVGIESGDQATLDLFGKRVTPQQNAAALAVLDSLGIIADFRALIFHPWTTLESLRTEVAFLESVLPHCPTVFDFRQVEIYAGTPLARRLSDEGRAVDGAWQMPYTLADPRAESLRQVHQSAFEESGRYRSIHEEQTREWFSWLLARRFAQSSSDADRARELRARTSRINSKLLDVWHTMLEFANGDEILDTEKIEARSREWSEQVDATL